MIKKIFTFLLLFTLTLIYSKQSISEQKKKIDTLISVADQYNSDYKTILLFKISQTILEKSNEISYDKGKSYAYYNIACCLYDVVNSEKSVKYAQKALSYETYLKDNPIQKARTMLLLGTNYRRLKLYELSKNAYQKALGILEKSSEKSDESRILKSSIYINIGSLCSQNNNLDSTYYYLHKNELILRGLNTENTYLNKSASEGQLGLYFNQIKNADSANYYFDKGLLLIKGKDNPYEIELLYGKGEAFSILNNTDKAIEYFEKALSVSKAKGLSEISGNEIDIYKKLAELYTANKNFEKASYFNKLYIKLNSTDDEIITTDRDFVLSEIEKQEKKDAKNLADKNRAKLIWTVIISSAVIVILIFLIQKNKKRKKAEIEKANQLLLLKNEIIKEEKQKNEILQLKVNDCFDEIANLAKSNSPEFFSRFQEVYPDFVNKISAISPKMRVSELTLCALIFLGFTTKDIAIYTFKSIHTIQGRRSALRQKLNLSPDESMELWMKSLMANSSTI